MDDEDKMIKKLEEHRDAKNLIIEIGEINGIKVEPTEKNDPKGDFKYLKKDEQKLINAIDVYLGHRKYKKEED